MRRAQLIPAPHAGVSAGEHAVGLQRAGDTLGERAREQRAEQVGALRRPGHPHFHAAGLQRLDDRIGDVARLQVLQPARLAETRAELGVHDERHHVADVDVRAHQAQLAAHRLGEPDDGVLGGGVGGAPGRAELAGLRGDVHDVPAIARHHPLERQLRPKDDTVQVDVDHAPRGQVVLVDEAAEVHDAGVVDEHVHRSELLFGAVEEGAERRAVADVEWQSDGARAQLGGGLAGHVEVHVADRDPHALAQQRLRGRLADAARGAGDRRRLPGEDSGLLGHALSS